MTTIIRGQRSRIENNITITKAIFLQTNIDEKFVSNKYCTYIGRDIKWNGILDYELGEAKYCIR